jgi:NADPH:quinone reductase-like Zn-dependent oxidoreductase
LALDCVGDTGMKRPSRLTQQGAIGRVLNQSMFEQISRVRGYTLPKQQTSPNKTRLDRLGPAKEMAQIGSAIGREFSHVARCFTASPPADWCTRRTSRLTWPSLFDLLRDGAIHPVVIDRLPLTGAREVHARIDAGGLGGKIVLLPWPTP